MKCPVCKNELPANPKTCDVCGFGKLNVEFYSVEGATNWVENVVLPYREQWKRTVEKQKQRTEHQNRSTSSSHSGEKTFADLTDFEFKFDDNGAIITKYLNYGFKSIVHIPETIYGKTVYYLGTSLFDGCKEIESVYIPPTVRIIGDNAFRGTGVKDIQLPPYLSAIGSFSFCGSKLQEIYLPYCVSFIGEGAFKDTNISNISFPERIKKIPRGVCSGCRNLKSATIFGAEDISTYAFSSCQNLEELILPETLVSISDDKEYRTGNSNLTMYSSLKLRDSSTLVLPRSLESIYVNRSLPARTIVAKNSNMKWNEDAGFGGFDFGNIFDSIFGGNTQTNYTIYCLPGSTSHEFARKRGYNVKQLSDFK